MELCHYTKHFKDKTVFCNCDDPKISNFFKYFVNNFKQLGLKKVIASCYKNKEKAYYCVYTGNEIEIKYLDSNGDFRSPESIKFLKEADIVVTNPPFSLFREYLAQLVEYDKKFIIMGNLNAISYKESFKLIKNNKLWLGVSVHSGDREFEVPVDSVLRTTKVRFNSEGKKFIRIPGVRWFTNLEYDKVNKPIELYRKYYDDPSLYPKYDNYEVININKVKDIPIDYDGVMGVPITFLDKWCPEQFEILMDTISRNTKVNGKITYDRIFIKHKKINGTE